MEIGRLLLLGIRALRIAGAVLAAGFAIAVVRSQFTPLAGGRAAVEEAAACLAAIGVVIVLGRLAAVVAQRESGRQIRR